MLESKAFSYSKPLGIQIGSNNRGPCPPCQDTQYDADRTLPDGQHGLAGLQAEGFDAFHTGIHWLDETSLLKRDALRDFHSALIDDPIHDADVLGEASTRGFEAGSASDLFVGGALGEGLVAAVVTVAAGDVMKDYDAVAGLEPGYSRPCGRYHA